jgi:repressor of nif and glnA expression
MFISLVDSRLGVILSRIEQKMIACRFVLGGDAGTILIFLFISNR